MLVREAMHQRGISATLRDRFLAYTQNHAKRPFANSHPIRPEHCPPEV